MATSKTNKKVTARLRSASGGKHKLRPAKPARSKSAAPGARPKTASKAARKAAPGKAARKTVKQVARKPAAKSAGKARAARAAPARPSTVKSTRLRGRSPGAAPSRTGKVAKSSMAIAKTRSSKTSKTGGSAQSRPAAKTAKSKSSKPGSTAKAGKAARSATGAAKATKATKATKGAGGKARPSPIAVARTARATGKFKLPHIDERTLKKIVAKLEEMREESLNVVNQNMQTDLKPREEASDVGDDLDQASNERDREFNLIMHQRHLRRLQQVEEAFERIEDGSYGLCEGTDEPINPRRLLIMPLARYSLEYQEQQEKTLGRAVEAEGYVEGEESFSAEE